MFRRPPSYYSGVGAHAKRAAGPLTGTPSDFEGIRDRYGLELTSGHNVNPVGDIDFMIVTGFALFEYEKVWRHPAPRNLRFK